MVELPKMATRGLRTTPKASHLLVIKLRSQKIWLPENGIAICKFNVELEGSHLTSSRITKVQEDESNYVADATLYGQNAELM